MSTTQALNRLFREALAQLLLVAPLTWGHAFVLMLRQIIASVAGKGKKDTDS
jgi:hypothetical protein